MNPHNLPPIPPIGQPPAPGTTHTNPGIVDVSSQCYPAVRAEDDQTQLRSNLASGSLVNSNGEEQRPAQLDTIGSNGVSVSAASVPLVSHSGDSGQRLDLSVAPTAESTGTGLPVDVSPDKVSHVMPSLPVIAQTTAPAITMDADTRRPGGLPSNVLIR